MRFFANKEVTSYFKAQEHRLDPFSWYRLKRERSPVFYDDGLRAWNLFTYEDVFKALSDNSVFSSKSRKDDPISHSMIATDPPEHKRLRSASSKAFAPSAVAALEPRILEIVDQTLDRIGTKSQIDAVSDLASVIPVGVIMELLGIAPDQGKDIV